MTKLCFKARTPFHTQMGIWNGNGCRLWKWQPENICRNILRLSLAVQTCTRLSFCGVIMSWYMTPPVNSLAVSWWTVMSLNIKILSLPNTSNIHISEIWFVTHSGNERVREVWNTFKGSSFPLSSMVTLLYCIFYSSFLKTTSLYSHLWFFFFSFLSLF